MISLKLLYVFVRKISKMPRKFIFFFLLYLINLKGSRPLQTSSFSLHSYYVVVSSQIHNRIQKCMGSLIRKDFVLTSAHCVRSNDGKKLKATVSVGDTFKGDISTENTTNVENCGFFTHQVDEIITHNRYLQNPHVNDIALLRIKPALPVDCGKVSPILLRKPKMANHYDTNVGIKFKKEMKFISSRNCAVFNEESARISPQNRCEIDDKAWTFCARINNKTADTHLGLDGRFSGLLVDERGVLLGTLIEDVYDKNGLYSGSKFVNVSSYTPWIGKELNERK